MKFCLQVLLIGSAFALARQPIVDLEEPDFSVLQSAKYADRAEAQKAFIPWIAADPKKALETLLQQYLKAQDPELRVRLFHLLERAYFPPVKGYLGIKMSPFGTGTVDGVLIQNVVEDSQAEHYGLQVNDRIMAINDWKANAGGNLNDRLAEQIQSYYPGEVIVVTLMRQGEEIKIDFRLGVFPTPGEMLREAGSPFAVPQDVIEKLKKFKDWFREQTLQHRETS